MDNEIRKKVYLKLYYSLLDWEWYKDANTMRVFLHLLLTANRKDHPYRGDVIKRGEVLATREHLAKQLKISEQNVRTALKHLKSTKEITVRKIVNTSVICLCNYDKYQSGDLNINHSLTDNQPKSNQSLTEEQPKVNQSLTTLRYCNNEENDIMKECVKGSHTHGKFNNVILTDEEYIQFTNDYPVIAQDVINQLSAKILTGDIKYQTGHIGHLYIFAKNHTNNLSAKPVRPYDPSCSDMSNINALILERSRNLDPTDTKRKTG